LTRKGRGTSPADFTTAQFQHFCATMHELPQSKAAGLANKPWRERLRLTKAGGHRKRAPQTLENIFQNLKSFLSWLATNDDSGLTREQADRLAAQLKVSKQVKQEHRNKTRDQLQYFRDEEIKRLFEGLWPRTRKPVEGA